MFVYQKTMLDRYYCIMSFFFHLTNCQPSLADVNPYKTCVIPISLNVAKFVNHQWFIDLNAWRYIFPR